MADEDKQFDPTPYKLKKAREEGQVVKSKDISTALSIITLFLLLYYMLPSLWQEIYKLFLIIFEHIPEKDIDTIGVPYLVTLVSVTFFSLVGPFLIVALLIAVAADFFQVGPLLSFKSIEPKFEKLNPVKGFKNLFSMRSLFELAKNIVKIIILGYVGWITFNHHLPALMSTGDAENIMVLIVVLGKMLMDFMMKAGAFFLAIGMLDYLFQRFNFMKDQKMSFKELKDEFKNTEGDPHVKQALRQRRMQMLQQSMMNNIPKADVIITNPIHIAVAIEYDNLVMEAPRVVAKGTELFAERIKDIAREYNIPIVENKPLAQTLYKLVEIDKEIPPELYEAVAEILMFAWKLHPKKRNPLSEQVKVPVA